MELGHNIHLIIQATLNILCLLGRNKGSLVRDLRLRCNPRQMPALASLPVHNSAMLGNAVIPDNHGAFLPLDSGLKVGAICKVIIEELENGIRLFFL